MSARSAHLKFIGAAGAAVLAVGMVATPAVAASQDLTYNCSSLGLVSVSLDPGPIPATMVAGQTSPRTMNMVVHVPDTLAPLVGGQTVTGSVVASGANNTFPFNLTIPSQTVPTTAPVDINASGPGKIRPLKAGIWTVKAGDIAANLVLSGIGPLSDTCLAPTDVTQNFGTIKVTKDKTNTTAKASYNARKDKATGTAKVKSHYGLKATGKVTFTLKKGHKKIAKATAKLNSRGIAKHVFAKVKKSGKYTITAKYAGNSNLNGSSDGARFRVK
jgi:hypothetical protein